MTNSTVEASGGAEAPVLLLSGVQRTEIADNRFRTSGAISVTHSVGSPDTRIVNNVLTDTPAPLVTELYWQGPARAVLAGNTQ